MVMVPKLEWNFPVTLNWYSLIDGRTKIIEGAVPYESDHTRNYSRLQVDDTIIFSAVNGRSIPIDLPKIRFKIRGITHYNSAREMLEDKDIEKILPGVTGIPEGIKIYHSILGYEERIRNYGIYAIELGERLYS